eukprot:756192-Hanusia_phi.AAC.1
MLSFSFSSPPFVLFPPPPPLFFLSLPGLVLNSSSSLCRILPSCTSENILCNAAAAAAAAAPDAVVLKEHFLRAIAAHALPTRQRSSAAFTRTARASHGRMDQS